RHQPDLFILYMGNNDFVGLHTAAPYALDLTLRPRWFHIVQWIKSSKLGQVVESFGETVFRSSRRTHEVFGDMDFFRKRRLAPDDPRRRRLHENFRVNFQE